MLSLALTITFALCAAPALAQTVGLTGSSCLAGASPEGCRSLDFGVDVQGVRVGGSTVGLGVGPGHLRLALRSAETFGPLGNVVFELDGALVEGPAAFGRLSARGVVASVAARAAVVAAGADEERFASVALATEGRPLLGGPVVGVELGGTFRLDRQVVLDIAPAVYLAPAGTALEAGATLRLLRALGPNELQAHLHGAVLPGGGGHGALGAALVLPRGSAPDWTFGAWLGVGEEGLQPGASLNVAEALGPGVKASLEAAYQPYRRDARPLRAALALDADLSGPTLTLRVAAGALHPGYPDAVATTIGLSWPLPAAR